MGVAAKDILVAATVLAILDATRARVAAQLAMEGIMKRLIAVVVLAPAVTFGCLGLKPVGATGTNVCSLITKQEASKIL